MLDNVEAGFLRDEFKVEDVLLLREKKARRFARKAFGGGDEFHVRLYPEGCQMLHKFFLQPFIIGKIDMITARWVVNI